MLDKHLMIILGGICFTVGVVIRYAIGKRRFNRRSITGTEVFKSYESAWITRLIEGVLGLIALFLIMAGVSACILSFA